MSCNVSSEQVTVAVFANSADAEMVRGQLTAANIESQLTTVDSSTSAGRVHVQVAQGDCESAMRVLFPVSERSRAPVAEIGSWTCPKCSQVVFDFSKVCWMCGTSREDVPPAPPAPETPTLEMPASGAGPPATAANGTVPSMVMPSLPPIPVAPAAAAPLDGAAAAPSEGAAATSRTLRFSRLPPPPGMAPDARPSNLPGGETQVGPAATPRFARVKSLDIPTVESPATNLAGKTGPSAVTGQSAAPSVDTKPGTPANMASTAAAVPADIAPADIAPADIAPADIAPADIAPAALAARFITQVKPAPQVRARLDPKEKEIESMTVWAWWTAVVGVLICPATVYSIWLLLTLTFAAARPSRAGRLRCVGAWCLNVVVIVVWFVVLQARM